MDTGTHCVICSLFKMCVDTPPLWHAHMMMGDDVHQMTGSNEHHFSMRLNTHIIMITLLRVYYDYII